MKKVFIVIAILLLSLILKLHNYDVYPQRGATSDEYTYSFLGLSLLTKHYPESWSNFPEYKYRYDLSIRGIYFPMVYPYFDHPPFNGLIVAGWALINGENTYQKIDLKIIRLVPIFLSFLSSILVFLVAKRLYGYEIAVWSLLIYSTVTIFVINSRVVLAENLVTPLFLLGLFLYDKWAKFMTGERAVILGIIAGLAVLAKELGISVYLSLTFFFITEKDKFKKFIYFTLAFLIVAASYVFYGFYFGWNTYINVVLHQASRQLGPEVLAMLTQQAVIVNKIYPDGWYFFGWFALFFMLSNIKENKRIVMPFIIYFLLLIISLTKEGEMGWYLIPLFPLMAIASAKIIKDAISENSWLILSLLTFVGITQIKFLYEDNFGLTSSVFRILIFLLFGPFAIALLFKKDKLFKNLSRLYFYLFILANIFLTYNYIHPA